MKKLAFIWGKFMAGGLLLLSFLLPTSAFCWDADISQTWTEDITDEQEELSFVYPKKKYQYEVAIASIFQNEASFLREWIEYYRMLGVKHFYLYNNLSTDNYKEVLKPYIKKGLVDLIEWPDKPSCQSEWNNIQIKAYNDAIEKSKKRAKWLAIIDIDEYIVPIIDDHLPGLLKRFENVAYGGICLRWVFFGTSHVSKIPEDKLLIETLTLNGGPAAGGDLSSIWSQGAYKSIVRPDRVSSCVSPHYCKYKNKFSHTMVIYESAQINHYWSKDEDFFYNVKIPRRQAWGQSVESALAWEAGMNVDTVFGKPILRFVPQLRKRLKMTD